MRILPFTADLGERWDTFVRSAKNGTFLLLRGYMDYHADRFQDASVIVAEDDGAWLALLPATQRDDVVSSHGGLTYGGVISDDRMTTPKMLEVFAALREHLRSCGVAQVLYKTVPSIYHRRPAEEDRYALFRVGATLSRRDVLSVLSPRAGLAFQERRRRAIKRAERAEIEVREGGGYTAYWGVLESTLEGRHGARPVHTVAEIELLTRRFPEAIRLFGAYKGADLLAGVLVYETPVVAHAQYIAASPAGRECGALDLIFDRLLRSTFLDKPFFDFGISNEDAGRTLNVGLIEQKEGFGGRAVVHDHYEWNLRV